MLKGLTKEKEENQTMNNKMAKDTYLLIESKKLSKQEQRQNHGYGDHFMVARWGGPGENQWRSEAFKKYK